jgi:hypothetical protein
MVTTAVAPAPGGDEPAKIGAVGRIFGVLFSPGETFADIARKPTWVPALLLLMIVNLAFNAVLANRVDWRVVAQQQVEKSKFAARQFEGLSDDKKEEAFARQGMIQKYTRYVAGIFAMPVLALIGGVVYMLAFNLFGGAGAKYKDAFCLACFAHIPMALHDLLGIPIALLKDPAAINPQNVVASNVGALLGTSAPLWQQGLATSIDVFGIWCMILVAIAFTAFNPRKLTLGKSIVIVIAVWAFFAIVGTGIAFAFS